MSKTDEVLAKALLYLSQRLFEHRHRPTDYRLDYCRCGDSWPCEARKERYKDQFENTELLKLLYEWRFDRYDQAYKLEEKTDRVLRATGMVTTEGNYGEKDEEKYPGWIF